MNIEHAVELRPGGLNVEHTVEGMNWLGLITTFGALGGVYLVALVLNFCGDVVRKDVYLETGGTFS